jgi:hypothetical protein
MGVLIYMSQGVVRNVTVSNTDTAFDVRGNTYYTKIENPIATLSNLGVNFELYSALGPNGNQIHNPRFSVNKCGYLLGEDNTIAGGGTCEAFLTTGYEVAGGSPSLSNNIVIDGQYFEPVTAAGQTGVLIDPGARDVHLDDAAWNNTPIWYSDGGLRTTVTSEGSGIGGTLPANHHYLDYWSNLKVACTGENIADSTYAFVDCAAAEVKGNALFSGTVGLGAASSSTPPLSTPVYIDNTNGNASTLMRFSNNGVAKGYIGYNGTTGETGMSVWNSSGTAVNMTIQNGGNVGIGTTNPGATLDVAGHTKATGAAPSFSGCGTGAALSANSTDTAGRMTLGTTPGSCALTFSSAFVTNAPICTVTFERGVPGAYSTALTTLTVTATGLSGAFDYRCSQ